MNNSKKESSHTGHRRRIKKRYFDNRGEGFDDHELLELLLFYAIPRKNTNEIAHELMERFGSISAISSASVDELKLVDGIGNNSAVLLNLVGSLAKKIAGEKKIERKRLNTIRKLVEYAEGFVFGATSEQVYLVMMDNSLRVIDAKLVAIGSINEVKPLIRNILELSIIKRASAVALAHNHPTGGVEASCNDVEFTTLLKRELEMVNIRFVEHVIVDGKSYNAIMQHLLGQDNIDEDISFDDLRAN